MESKGNQKYSNVVYTLRILHIVLLWLAISLLLNSTAHCKRHFPRIRKRFFYYCFIFALCGILISVLYFLFYTQNTLQDGIAWITWFSAILWFIVLVYCVYYIQILNKIFILLFLILMFIEWSNIILQFYIFKNLTTDIVVNIILALPHTVALIALVDWNWLMINDIAFIFYKIKLHESVDNNKKENDNDKNINFLNSLPLSDELSADLFNFEFSSMDKCVNQRRSIIMEMTQRWGFMYMLIALVRLLYEIGGLLPAYLLRGLVDNLIQANVDEGKKNNDGGDIQTCVITILLIIVSTLTCTFLRVHYNMKLQKMALHNRVFLTLELFRRVIVCRKYQLKNYTEGDIINYLSVDIQRVANAVQTLNDLWALPVQLLFVLYFLYIEVSFAFIAGVMVTLVLIPINMYLTKRIKHVQTGLMQANDERVMKITEIFNNIVYIKMCGWSRMVQKWVEIPRERYMKYLSWLKYMDALCVFFWAVTPTLVSLLTFITFMSIGGELTPSKAVTALTLFSSLILPLNAYPWVINGIVEAYVSWRRLQPFLEMPLNNLSNHDKVPFVVFNNNGSDEKTQPNFKEKILTTIRDDENKDQGTLYISGEVQSLPYVENQVHRVHRVEASQLNYIHQWRSVKSDVLVNITKGELSLNINNENSDIHKTFTLQIPTFHASCGQLIALVGPSGSGKSLFLDTLAGEFIIQPSVAMTVIQASMAYVEQQPFLMAGTIRENILFGRSYDSVKYNAVIKAVSLTEDLYYNFAPDGDNILVGDRGRKLSGGQRIRVALARALYADKNLYLIDDILGCLDITVLRHIIKEVFLMLVRNGKCVIIATHHEDVIQYADVVYLCVNGSLSPINKGNVIDMLLTSGKTIRELQDSTNILQDKEEQQKNKKKEIEIDYNVKTNTTLSTLSISSSLELTEGGGIAWSTVKSYINHIGWKLTICIIFSIASMQITRNASDQYILIWSKRDNNDKYIFLYILIILTLLNCLLALCRGFCFAIGGLKAARQFHNELLYHFIFTTFSFLMNTSNGNIINCLLNDIYKIDNSLPFMINILLSQIFLLIGISIIIIINSTVIIILIFPVVLLCYYYIQHSYRIVLRILQRLENTTQTLLLDILRIFLDGGVVIRSFGYDSFLFYTYRLRKQFEIILKREYNMLLLNAWFSLRLECVGILLFIFIGILIFYYYGNSYAPFFGIALAYVQSLTSYVSGVISAFVSTERELISVERVCQYLQLENENTVKQKKKYIHWMKINKWNPVGNIKFTNVSMRYDVYGQQILNELTFYINSGEKVAIVGRTGAGKSSIFFALLRLVNIESGFITIDDIDSEQLPLEVLRRGFGIIPQEPFIFNDTVRKNIDPFELYNDDEIYTVLANVELNNLNLDMNIFNYGYMRGGVQYQIAIARVLLQQSRILLLDEPTLKMNFETELSLWRALDLYMKGTTIICITHKLTHIDFFDRVMVIDKGRLVNSGPPSLLRRHQMWPFSED